MILLEKLIVKWAQRIIRQDRLEKWKDEKRKKWLEEGRNPEDIERELSLHKIK